MSATQSLHTLTTLLSTVIRWSGVGSLAHACVSRLGQVLPKLSVLTRLLGDCKLNVMPTPTSYYNLLDSDRYTASARLTPKKYRARVRALVIDQAKIIDKESL